METSNDHRKTGTFELTQQNPDIYKQSVEMQTELFKRDISWHNTFADECCPDFSCCSHKTSASFQSLQGKASNDFLPVLEENYQALIKEYENDVLKSTAYIVLKETYEDLISIYKSMQSSTSVTEEWIRVEDENITTLSDTTDYAVIFKHTGAKEVKTGFAIKVQPFFYSHYLPLPPSPNTK